MLTFSHFIAERQMTTDPHQLATRLARRYGTKTSFGKWEKVEKHGHIPLTTYSARPANAAANALYKHQTKLGLDDKDPETRSQARIVYQSQHTQKHMNISDLAPTQPFVRTDDPHKLRTKLETQHPSHIHVTTHKGVHYIADGHHSVYAAHLRGDKTVPVSHIDLDNHK